MTDLQKQIVRVLGIKGQPMRPIDIAREIGGRKKPEINRELYRMKDDGQVELAENTPPKWRLKTASDTPSVGPKEGATCASRGVNDSETPKRTTSSASASASLVETADGGVATGKSETDVEQKLLDALKKSPGPKSALALAKEVGKEGRRDVNPILHGLEKQGLVKKISPPGDVRPLWTLVNQSGEGGSGQRASTNLAVADSDHDQSQGNRIAKWKGSDLYTRKDSGDGSITFSPLPKKQVLEPEVTPTQSVTEEPKQYSGALELQQARDDKEAFGRLSVEPRPRAEGSGSHDLATFTDPSLQKHVGKQKPRRILAAIFGNLESADSTNSVETRKKEIISLLSKTKQLNAFEVATELGMEHRGGAMALLRSLKEEGKVVEEEEEGISRWKLVED